MDIKTAMRARCLDYPGGIDHNLNWLISIVLITASAGKSASPRFPGAYSIRQMNLQRLDNEFSARFVPAVFRPLFVEAPVVFPGQRKEDNPWRRQLTWSLQGTSASILLPYSQRATHARSKKSCSYR